MATENEITGSKPICSTKAAGWLRFGSARFAISARLPWKDGWIDWRSRSGVEATGAPRKFQRRPDKTSMEREEL